MTISGRWSLTLGAGTLAFALLSMTFLLSTTVLEAIGALASVQSQVRGTEWATGPIILATLGRRHLRPLTPTPITRLRACCAATGAAPS